MGARVLREKIEVNGKPALSVTVEFPEDKRSFGVTVSLDGKIGATTALKMLEENILKKQVGLDSHRLHMDTFYWMEKYYKENPID